LIIKQKFQKLSIIVVEGGEGKKFIKFYNYSKFEDNTTRQVDQIKFIVIV
jgi:hypothetical protein